MSNLPSPCISVCQLDAEAKRCLGCTRTLEQIEAWVMLDDNERLAIWRQLASHLDLGLEATFATRVGAERARALALRYEAS
jgi:predicted Fe-S protein YdhL (DUF1289 family)